MTKPRRIALYLHEMFGDDWDMEICDDAHDWEAPIHKIYHEAALFYIHRTNSLHGWSKLYAKTNNVFRLEILETIQDVHKFIQKQMAVADMAI